MHSKSSGQYQGLFQLPQQIGPALVHLGRHKVRSYVEVGIWTAWTTNLVTHYLQRVNAEPIYGHAVDVTFGRVKHQTHDLLKAANISLKNPTADQAELAALRWDLCFIDASHLYSDVRRDYESYKDRCGLMMFHDINDYSNFHSATQGGGVPLFWQHLVDSVGASDAHEHVHEFTVQPADSAPSQPHAPSLGIGIVNPGGRGGGAGTGPSEPLFPALVPTWNQSLWEALSAAEKDELWASLASRREQARRPLEAR